MARGRRGVTALEFALVLPVLVALIFGLVENCWYFHERLVVVRAVSEAARRASVTALDGDWAGAATERAAEVLAELGLASASHEVEAALSTDANGESQVTVHLTMAAPTLLGLGLAPSTIEVSAAARMEDQGG